MRAIHRYCFNWPLLAALAAGTAMVGPVQAADVTQERLENADKEPQNWLTALQNYSSQRYSRLDQINRDTVRNLHVAFTLPIPTELIGAPNASLENPPLVIDGMMYFNDTWGTVYKADVTDASLPRMLWVSDPAVNKDMATGIHATRGIAAWGNKIYNNLIDGRVVAFDADTGEIVWDKQIGGQEPDWEFDAAEGFTAAPLAVEGKILVGQSKGDWGTRGWLAALDAESGEQLWKTYTIPGPGEPGHESWADDHNAWRTGGGALWQTGSYDPSTKLTIWGTANPVPMFDPEFRPGDNLFTNSALAFQIDDGKIAWYFQYSPNESWDYDEIGVHMLVDATVNGEDRKLVTHFGRNGFFYELDRTNGQFVASAQWVAKVTWTAGIDPKTGKPVEYDPSKQLQTYIPETRQRRADNPDIVFCPTAAGGVRWQPPALNPDKMVEYVAGAEGCTAIRVGPKDPLPNGGNPNGVNQFFLGNAPGITPQPVAKGRLTAMSVTDAQIVANLDLPYHNLSGVLATAGGLVFTGHQDGRITAHNDDTLQEVWSFPTGIAFKAPAIAYGVGGKEYIAILAGGSGGGAGYPELANMKTGAMLYVFGL